MKKLCDLNDLKIKINYKTKQTLIKYSPRHYRLPRALATGAREYVSRPNPKRKTNTTSRLRILRTPTYNFSGIFRGVWILTFIWIETGSRNCLLPLKKRRSWRRDYTEEWRWRLGFHRLFIDRSQKNRCARILTCKRRWSQTINNINYTRYGFRK